jgi:multifunctional methyltransferase subunit TRM112
MGCSFSQQCSVSILKGASELGISTLPYTLTESLAEDPAFLQALYHIIMNVHLVKGMLTCPVTGREFPVQDGIPNMMLEEEECERVRL